MTQFNYRIGNIELRSDMHGTSLEIVQWSDKMCWGIVSFHKSRDTAKWNAYFSEDRPLDKNVNWKHLRILIVAAYEYSQTAYNDEECQGNG